MVSLQGDLLFNAGQTEERLLAGSAEELSLSLLVVVWVFNLGMGWDGMGWDGMGWDLYSRTGDVLPALQEGTGLPEPPATSLGGRSCTLGDQNYN